MVREVRKNPPGRLLDLACGTGSLTRLLAKNLPVCPSDGALPPITGADPSEAMLQKARRQPRPNIQYVNALAEHLPFDDHCFDAVTICYGIRNFEDRPLAFTQVYRTLQPGGCLYILEFSLPRPSFWNAPQRMYIHRILPLLGAWSTGDRNAYDYLKNTVESFPSPDVIRKELCGAGFATVTCKRLWPAVVVLYSAQK